MERNNLKDSNLGGGGGGGKSMKVKSPWECSSSSNTSNFSEEYITGFSWPPRSYICSFCKREFRSAQALGGHMNVHRRDRARLRQSPPSLPLPPRNHTIPNLNLNPNPNPNPNFSSTPLSSPRSPPTRLVQPSSPPLSSSYTACCTLPSLVSPSSIERKKSVDDNNASTQVLLNNLRSPSLKKGSDLAREKTAKSLFGVREFSGGFSQENGSVVLKNTEIVGLELGIGLNGDLKDEDHVDLELRLGYS